MSPKDKSMAKAKRQERYERKEKLTNWYMINLSWGIAGIILFLILGNCYKSVNILIHMQVVTWVMTGVFAAGAAVLLVLGKAGKIKNKKRAYNYSIFLAVCAVFSLWLALFNRVRLVLEKACQVILNNAQFAVSSYWNTRIPIILIAVYLVVAFIIYLIKMARE